MFYAEHDGVLYFGSEVKSLVAAGVPAVWDTKSYISRSFSFGSCTLFKGIKSLPPGTFGLGTKRGVHIKQYWDLAYPRQDVATTPECPGVVIERVREGLEEAVRLRMRADVPIAYYLSGGVDSSAILAIASRIAGAPLPAFTIAFNGVEGEDCDETLYARLMAEHVGADHHVIDISSQLLADGFNKAIWHNEYPFFNAHGIAKSILSEAVQKAGFKVAMTGEGADEMFAGYPHFRRDMERAGARHDIRASRPTYTDGISQPTFIEDMLGCGVSWIENQNGMISKIMPLMNPGLMLEAGSIEPIQMFIERIDVRGKISHRHPMHAAMYLWAKSFLPSFVLTTLGDRMEMANSVEGRVPFLDHHLAEISFGVPASLKVQGKTEKHILREALKPYLPEAIRLRKKHYFRAPAALQKIRTPMSEKIFDTLTSKFVESLPFFDKKAVHLLLDATTKASVGELQLLDPVLTELASLCVMQEQFSLAG